MQVVLFFAYIENKFKVTVKTIRTDNGTEIRKKECGKIIGDRGFVHQTKECSKNSSTEWES